MGLTSGSNHQPHVITTCLHSNHTHISQQSRFHSLEKKIHSNHVLDFHLISILTGVGVVGLVVGVTAGVGVTVRGAGVGADPVLPGVSEHSCSQDC